MARRPTLRERQKVITSVIAMWFQLMQEYMILLSKLAVAIARIESTRRVDPMQSGQKRTRQQATDEVLASIKVQMERFQDSITTTTGHIERLTNTWCLPVDIASRREYIVDEVKRLEGITYAQSLKAIRMLMKDQADLETFFKMPSDVMKVDFILSMLE
ncbi:hypothetical protein LINPERHAP1_LOCUS35136 [Linum perenne]